MTEPTVRRQAQFLEAGLMSYVEKLSTYDPVAVMAKSFSFEKARRMEEVAWWALKVYGNTNWCARPLWWKIQRHRTPDTRIVLRYRWP